MSALERSVGMGMGEIMRKNNERLKGIGVGGCRGGGGKTTPGGQKYREYRECKSGGCRARRVGR